MLINREASSTIFHLVSQGGGSMGTFMGYFILDNTAAPTCKGSFEDRGLNRRYIPTLLHFSVPAQPWFS